MKDIATFETAVRLKEAGFPQPIPEAGQWWYNPDFGVFLVGKLYMVDGRLRNIFYPDTGKGINKEIRLFVNFVFAPTATDILRELLPLIFELYYSKTNDDFVLQRRSDDDNTLYAFYNENPAEAVAEAWLKLNEKK